MNSPYEVSNGNIGRITVRCWQDKPSRFSIQSMQHVGQDKAVDILCGKLPDHLYVMRWVEYQDGMHDQETDSRLTRRTAFCRKFDIDTKRFVRVKDDDYEYEE